MAAITRRAEETPGLALLFAYLAIPIDLMPGATDRAARKNASPCLLDCYARFGVSASCVRVRTRRYSLPNSDNPNLHPMMNEMTNQTAPMIVAIIENILALLECS
jgi:hypothetical protein